MSDFKYFAFISYNQHDIAWGRRLQRKLENYRMPSALCRSHGCLRKPINPVFFAPYDIQPNDLSQELKSRLEASKNLIVICSPNSARSVWVGREIEYFYSLGRANDIYFFIIEGEPNSDDPATECYNPQIKALGLNGRLGVNINEHVFRWSYYNRERAYIQLITKLLGLEFDSLWKRHRRNMIKDIVITMVGFIAIVVTLFVVAAYSRPVDVEVELIKQRNDNTALPNIKNGEITLYLPNDTISKPVNGFATMLFPNIPRRVINSDVRITVEGDYFFKQDTVIALSDRIIIPIERDSMIFGHVKFRLLDRNFAPISGELVKIDDIECKTDKGGVVDIYIPYSRQKERYTIESRRALQQSVIEMPCCVMDNCAIIVAL